MGHNDINDCRNPSSPDFCSVNVGQNENERVPLKALFNSVVNEDVDSERQAMR